MRSIGTAQTPGMSLGAPSRGQGRTPQSGGVLRTLYSSSRARVGRLRLDFLIHTFANVSFCTCRIPCFRHFRGPVSKTNTRIDTPNGHHLGPQIQPHAPLKGWGTGLKHGQSRTPNLAPQNRPESDQVRDTLGAQSDEIGILYAYALRPSKQIGLVLHPETPLHSLGGRIQGLADPQSQHQRRRCPPRA